MRLFVFGLGYSALTLIERHAAMLTHVAGTVTSAEKAATLRHGGIEAFVFDAETGRAEPGLEEALRRAEAVVQSIPPEASGDPALARFGADIAAGSPRVLAYLSTVGVYGDHAGAWVDAATPATPGQPRSRWRLAAETAWTALGDRMGVPTRVLRIAGIYGPGRNALLDVRSGRARRIIKPGQVFNRIHVEDIAAMLATALALTGGSAIFDLADDEPAPNADVVAHAAALLGLPPPPEAAFEAAGLSGMGASFWAENRRVSNARTKAALGLSLIHPTYREGLAALLAAGEGRA